MVVIVPVGLIVATVVGVILHEPPPGAPEITAVDPRHIDEPTIGKGMAFTVTERTAELPPTV